MQKQHHAYNDDLDFGICTLESGQFDVTTLLMDLLYALDAHISRALQAVATQSTNGPFSSFTDDTAGMSTK